MVFLWLRSLLFLLWGVLFLLWRVVVFVTYTVFVCLKCLFGEFMFDFVVRVVFLFVFVLGRGKMDASLLSNRCLLLLRAYFLHCFWEEDMFDSGYSRIFQCLFVEGCAFDGFLVVF